MIESLVTLCVHRIFEDRQQALKFHADEKGIFHLELRITRMDAGSLNPDFAGSGIEIFIFDLADRTAVYRISNRCTEVFHIEVIRAASDLLVRRKSNADLAVRDLRGGSGNILHRHDLRHACLIVGAQKRGSVGYDQILTF